MELHRPPLFLPEVGELRAPLPTFAGQIRLRRGGATVHERRRPAVQQRRRDAVQEGRAGPWRDVRRTLALIERGLELLEVLRDSVGGLLVKVLKPSKENTLSAASPVRPNKHANDKLETGTQIIFFPIVLFFLSSWFRQLPFTRRLLLYLY